MSPPPDFQPPAGERAAKTAEAAAGSAAPKAVVVVVRLGPAEFALPIDAVREVLRAPPMSRVPFAPRAVCGVISVRGDVVPVVDLGARLLRRPARRPGTVVLVMPGKAPEVVGLLADSVAELIAADPTEFVTPPAEAEATLRPGWARGVLVAGSGRLITLLDLSAVLGVEAPDPPAAPSVIPHRFPAHG
jgi:purine-binding chemotaxis protein CheW